MRGTRLLECCSSHPKPTITVSRDLSLPSAYSPKHEPDAGIGLPSNSAPAVPGSELSAGVRRLRATYCAQLPTTPLILPGPGVGYEASTVGTAIDQRFRLSFARVAAVDEATELGISTLGATAMPLDEHPAWDAIEVVGHQLLERAQGNASPQRLDDVGSGSDVATTIICSAQNADRSANFRARTSRSSRTCHRWS